jgi:DNA-binding MarR family transcriptional regulator
MSSADLDLQAHELMLHIQAVADRVFRDAASPDLTRREAALLRLLVRDALPMGSLASGLGLAVSTVTGLVDRLVERGLVTRDRPSGDRRVVVVRRSARGKRASDRHQQTRAALALAMLEALTPAERTRFLNMFRKIAGTK